MEKQSIKTLLDETVDLLTNIVITQRSDVFKVAIIDSDGRKEELEDSFEHTKALANVLLEQNIPMIYELLGIESE